MMPDDPSSQGGWESGWKGHEEAQLRRLACLPLDKKLEWLEQAQRLAARLSAKAAKGSRP